MKQFSVFAVLIFAISCSSTKTLNNDYKQVLLDEYTFLLTEISTDKSYGFSKKNAVNVGGIKTSEGPTNERRYLNSLAGPNGEKVAYFRAGSCCPVKSENGFMGKAMLDNYRVTWEGSKDTVSIYINMYDKAELKAPYGFSIKK